MKEITEIFTHSINDPIILIIFFIMVILCIFELKTKKDYKHIIISLGVFGTFLGILIGLLHFNTNDITNSVPQLLEGLKFAFITSLLGMAFSIGLSFIEKLSNQLNEDSSTEDLLTGSLDMQRQTNKSILSIETLLKNSLNEQQQTNENILSMYKFIEKTNVDNIRYFAKINESLKEAVATLSKGATEEIIKALEGVIADFNNNLTEQFGDNFKQLNEAVKNMIVWQENYKIAIENIERNLQSTMESLEKNEEYTLNLTTNYEKISDTSKNLSNIIQTNENQIKNLETHMNSLKKIGDESGLIVKSINDFSKSIQGSLSNQSQGLNTLSDNLNNSLNNLNTALTSLTDKFRADYQVFLDRVKQLLPG